MPMEPRYDSREREGELILTPNEFAFVLDKTKGDVNVLVGPHKTSLAGTDQPVLFDTKLKKFTECSLERCRQLFCIAPKGWYIQMKNPEKSGQAPKIGVKNSSGDLEIGKKHNIQGPVSFALWPGQMAKIIEGHKLRSNQYLIVRVYDEEAARENLGKAVVMPKEVEEEAGEESAEKKKGGRKKPEKSTAIQLIDPEKITTGKLFVIKGTDVSFYIPPTGIEVVPEEIVGDKPRYIREAVSLERLEYCILLDEDGTKTFKYGEDVVFPEPTQIFIQLNGSRKFRALELSDISGIYVKVIKPYTDEKGKKHVQGEELFITGKDQMIYFPRPEHVIIRYGEKKNDIHYAIAIPKGEGRYVLNKETSEVTIKRGPFMFLPDPRKEVVVKRILSQSEVELYFPGNSEAKKYNVALGESLARKKATKGQKTEGPQQLLQSDIAYSDMEEISKTDKVSLEKASQTTFSNEFNRKGTYTPPRTITLDTKYEGCVTINVWSGYAVKVVSKTGENKILVGDTTYLLEYDEHLEPLSFSTGKPKSADNLERSVYLRITNNKISDIVEGETKDFCKVRIYLSYRVNFINEKDGDEKRWFDVENYVKLICDHLRSIIKREIKSYDIQEFYIRSTDIIRDVILGEKDKDGARKGSFFEENSSKVYDIEVLDIEIEDQGIKELLLEAQHEAVRQAITISREQKEADLLKEKEKIKREVIEENVKTAELDKEAGIKRLNYEHEKEITRISQKHTESKTTLESKLNEQKELGEIQKQRLERAKLELDQRVRFDELNLNMKIKKIEALAKADTERLKSLDPQLTAAIQSLADTMNLKSITPELVTMSFLENQSIGGTLVNLFKGTPLEPTILKMASRIDKKTQTKKLTKKTTPPKEE